jgi:hypothetical protein
MNRGQVIIVVQIAFNATTIQFCPDIFRLNAPAQRGYRATKLFGATPTIPVNTSVAIKCFKSDRNK